MRLPLISLSLSLALLASLAARADPPTEDTVEPPAPTAVAEVEAPEVEAPEVEAPEVAAPEVAAPEETVEDWLIDLSPGDADRWFQDGK